MNLDGECAGYQLTGWELPAVEEEYLKELQLHFWLLSNIQCAKLDLLIIITGNSKY